MADTKVSALTAIATALSTDRLPAARSPFGATDNGYITPAVLASFVAASGLVAGLGTNTFTSRQVITMGATNLGVIAASAYSLTGTDASNMLDFAGTWNTSGSPTALKINITNTASGAAARLLDLQVGGVSKFAVDVNGAVTTGASLNNMTDTWNNAGTTFTGIKLAVTDTASASGSKLIDLLVGASSLFSVRKDGTLAAAYGTFASYVTCTGNIQIGTNSPTLIYLGSSLDTIIGRAAAASFQFGGADAATPIAQSFQAQSVVAGTSNIAGADWTFKASKGTGTGQGGGFVWQTAPAGSSGTAQNALATALAIDGPGNVVVGNAALATNATDGFFYAPSSAGAPSGTPTTKTGRVPMQFDTTNGRLYAYYGAAWHQVGLT